MLANENVGNVYIDTVELPTPVEFSKEGITSVFSSYHDQDCCEHHWIDFNQDEFIQDAVKSSGMDTFDKVIIKGVPGIGILLRFFKGEQESPAILFPGFNSNNGYYSTNLELVVTLPNGFSKRYWVSQYQDLLSTY